MLAPMRGARCARATEARATSGTLKGVLAPVGQMCEQGFVALISKHERRFAAESAVDLCVGRGVHSGPYSGQSPVFTPGTSQCPGSCAS